LADPRPKRDGLWRYFDFLPVEREKNIFSSGEGIVPIDRWKFLEDFARETSDLRLSVYAHRHDDNYSTGTFKDLAGSVVASTGNIGVSYSRYLSAAGITLYGFIPGNSSKSQEAEIGCFGQNVFRVKGDYTLAKELALEFSQKYGFLLAAGNFDPMRIEAKKTMAYEWLRLLPKFPSVYIQALSGGTGPLGIAKAYRELAGLSFFDQLPRFLLVQTDKCSPMADAWAEAKSKGFPKDWELSYPIYRNPNTCIPTLATGYPKTYPEIAKLTRESGGEIMAFPEFETPDMARWVAYETAVRIGPSAAIAMGGFLKALKNGYLKNGDVVLINIGEGIRRSPEFMNELIYQTSIVRSLADCRLARRTKYGNQIRDAIHRILEQI
jgi:threonine synthase